MYFAEDVVAADAAVLKALTSKDLVLADEGVQLLTAALLDLIFLARSTTA
jgi:hypothetical protein